MEHQDKLQLHDAKCFMVSCMDFRFIDEIKQAMDSMGYDNTYDHFILAGASLGLTQEKFPHWGKVALDHMEIGRSLHHFREIFVFDHMDCGAFKKFYKIESTEEEIKLHKEHIQLTYNKLSKKFPNFKFRAFLMDLEGKFVEIEIEKNAVEFEVKEGSIDGHFLNDYKKCCYKKNK